jgi:hypothetical protein
VHTSSGIRISDFEFATQKQAQLAPEQTQLQVLLSRVHQIETERALLLDPHQKAVKRLATAESKLEELLNDEVPKSKALEDACAQRDEHTQVLISGLLVLSYWLCCEL